MEEPRKVMKAQYIGSIQVRRPSGMETLNDAIDQMMSQVPADQWRDVNVAVAPSVVTITDADVIVCCLNVSYNFLYLLIPIFMFTG